jgi:membrane-bound lytic murein transglycosylase D
MKTLAFVNTHGIRGIGNRFTRMLLGLAVLGSCVATGASAQSEYPRIPSLESSVQFWTNVYGRWSENEIVFHDVDDLARVYRKVQVPARGTKIKGLSRSAAIKAAKAELLTALKRLDKKKPTGPAGLNPLEEEIYLNLEAINDRRKYKRGGQIRAQNGIRERFRRGYIAAGQFEPEVRRTLKAMGMPESLVALAYVESLMNPDARSRSGAVGVWQFMPETGKEYMHVNQIVDERKDPILATEAAAKYLRTALEKVGPWPVAITSYNVGRAGMRRVMRAMGTSDLGVISAKYRKGFFGFAARNYYASFIAVGDILKHIESFFPGDKQRKPWSYDVIQLPHPISLRALLKAGSLKRSQIVSLNRSLSSRIRSSKLKLPRGLPLRIPKEIDALAFTAKLNALGSNQSASKRRKDKSHKVRKGENLWKIARRHGLSANQLAKRNGLNPSTPIYVGQVLMIPDVRNRFSLLPQIRGKRPRQLSIPTQMQVKPRPAAQQRKPLAADGARNPKKHIEEKASKKQLRSKVKLHWLKKGAEEETRIDTSILLGSDTSGAIPDVYTGQRDGPSLETGSAHRPHDEAAGKPDATPSESAPTPGLKEDPQPSS